MPTDKTDKVEPTYPHLRCVVPDRKGVSSGHITALVTPATSAAYEVIRGSIKRRSTTQIRGLSTRRMGVMRGTVGMSGMDEGDGLLGYGRNTRRGHLQPAFFGRLEFGLGLGRGMEQELGGSDGFRERMLGQQGIGGFGGLGGGGLGAMSHMMPQPAFGGGSLGGGISALRMQDPFKQGPYGGGLANPMMTQQGFRGIGGGGGGNFLRHPQFHPDWPPPPRAPSPDDWHKDGLFAKARANYKDD
ncbi:hypothetical protein BKA65DRAFT_583286 [Rhexocercosporidium sp. MPI-PUGE-AT-0058]|nr:hypothetical protein BKA65DRAFT_583286 [Rhexocercosporidium sp. MPI-PUGE-AT-0058]